MNKPKVSVITVTYNNLSGLTSTVESFNKQTYPNKELIIVDNDSDDGTKSFLTTLKGDDISYRSEKDNGIYHGMNKGINMSNGEWIIFMNAGDLFYSDSLLSALQPYLNKKDIDVIYGKTEINYPTFNKTRAPLELEKIWKHLPFIHQSVLVRSKWMKEKKFSLSYRYCADYDFFCHLYTKGASFLESGKIFSHIQAGGISDKRRIIATREVKRISSNYFGKSPGRTFYFHSKIIGSYLILLLKKIIGEKGNALATKMKYAIKN